MNKKELLEKFFQLFPCYKFDEVLDVICLGSNKHEIILVMADMGCNLKFYYANDCNFILKTISKNFTKEMQKLFSDLNDSKKKEETKNG